MAKILVLSDLWLPFPGGAERLMFNLARDLHRRPEHQVHVLTGYEQPQQFDGPTVGRADISLDMDGWAHVQGVIDAWGPDVLLVHHLYARTFHAPLTRQGLPIVEVVLNGERMPEAQLAVFISEWVARQGARRPGDLVLTPPAFDDVVADRHGDAIGFIKPIPHKGVDLIYKVAKYLPGRRFVILRGEWQTLEVIRPAPNIEFMEPVADVRDFYRELRLVLMPSRSEDAGTVAQEAALNRLPCISSNVGGLAETNAGGVQLNPEHPAPWVRAIRALDDPAAYNQVVERQLVHLHDTDHQATLDQLATQIGAL